MESKEDDMRRLEVMQMEGSHEQDVWKMKQLVQDEFSHDQIGSSQMVGDEIDQIRVQNITTPPLPIQMTFPINQKESFNRRLQSSIIKKYTKLTRINPQITKFLSSIVKDIKNNLLVTSKPTPIANTPQPIQTLIPPMQHKESTQPAIPSKIVADSAVMKQSCFRSLLVQNHGDNDVPSDEQDMNAGIRYMYGELLYSVGNELVNQRKQSQSHVKAKEDGNKENQDMNNRQQLSNSKAHIGKTANKNPKTNTKMQQNRTSQVKARTNIQPLHNIKPQILRL